MVSHNIRQVERLCGRAILLDHGHIVMDGDSQTVCDLFYEKSDEKIRNGAPATSNHVRKLQDSGELELLDIALIDSQNSSIETIPYRGDFTLRVHILVHAALEDLTIGFGIHTTDFLYLTTSNSEDQLHIRKLACGEHELICKVCNLPLLPGVFSIRLGITEGRAARSIFYAENLLHFQVAGSQTYIPITVRDGFFEMQTTWGVTAGDNLVEYTEGRQFP